MNAFEGPKLCSLSLLFTVLLAALLVPAFAGAAARHITNTTTSVPVPPPHGDPFGRSTTTVASTTMVPVTTQSTSTSTSTITPATATVPAANSVTSVVSASNPTPGDSGFDSSSPSDGPSPAPACSSPTQLTLGSSSGTYDVIIGSNVPGSSVLHFNVTINNPNGAPHGSQYTVNLIMIGSPNTAVGTVTVNDRQGATPVETSYAFSRVGTYQFYISVSVPGAGVFNTPVDTVRALQDLVATMAPKNAIIPQGQLDQLRINLTNNFRFMSGVAASPSYIYALNVVQTAPNGAQSVVAVSPPGGFDVPSSQSRWDAFSFYVRNLTQVGTYHYLMYVSDYVDGTNATAMASITVFAGSNAPLSLGSPAMIAPRLSLALGQNETVTANVVGGTSPYSYSWKLNGRQVGSNSNSLKLYANSSDLGQDNVSVAVTDAASGKASGSITVTVSAAPGSSPLVSIPDSIIDVGQSETVSANPANAMFAGPYTYSWKINGNEIRQASGSMLFRGNLSDLGINNVTLTMIGVHGNRVSGSGFITVNPNLTSNDLTVSIPDGTIQLGQSEAVTAMVGGGAMPMSYSWSINGNPIGQSRRSITFNGNSSTLGGDTVTATVTDAAGETASASGHISVVNATSPIVPTPPQSTGGGCGACIGGGESFTGGLPPSTVPITVAATTTAPATTTIVAPARASNTTTQTTANQSGTPKSTTVTVKNVPSSGLTPPSLVTSLFIIVIVLLLVILALLLMLGKRGDANAAALSDDEKAEAALTATAAEGAQDEVPPIQNAGQEEPPEQEEKAAAPAPRKRARRQQKKEAE